MAKLDVIEREHTKHSVTRKLRLEGKIPAVVYGKTVGNKLVAVDEGEMIRLFHSEGRNAIIQLKIGKDNPYSVMAHDIQFDHLKDEMLHIDFMEINMKSEIEAEVPFHLTGESAGEKEGGVVNQPVIHLLVKALPADLPNHIDLDISDLNVGDSRQVKDIKIDGEYEILSDEEVVVVSIVAPAVEEEEQSEATEEEVPADDVEATEEKREDDRPGRVD